MSINKKLAQAIRFFPLAIAALFSVVLLISSFFLYQEKEKFLATFLQRNFSTEQKNKAVNHSLQLKMYSEYQARMLDQTIEKQVHHRLKLAQELIESTYNANKEGSIKEITTQVVNIFKNLHYQKSDSYFFLCKGDGTELLTPLPQKTGKCEGAIAWDLKRNKISPDRTYNKQKLRNWWVPRQKEKQDLVTYKKTGGVLWFLPLDLLVGTGNYVESSRKILEQETIDWIEKIYAQNFSQVFIFDKKGAVLFAKDKKSPTEKDIHPADWYIDGHPLNFSRIKEIKRHENGYFANVSKGKTEAPEMFYIRILPEWELAVFTSVDLEEKEADIHQELSAIHQKNLNSLFLMMASCILLIALAGWGTILVSRKISTFLSGKLMTDELTGLPNRHHFMMHVKPILSKTSCAAVINIDIDNFSSISERYSRDAGDMLLRQIAQRLRSVFPPNQLCHADGDEFLIFLPNFEQKKRIDTCSSTAPINTIKTLFSQPFFIENIPIDITFSSGCCGKNARNLSLEELIHRASVALFRAKEEGQNNHKCYSDIKKQVKRARTLADSFCNAITNEEISVVYQPLYLNGSDSIFRLEALSRWLHPELGDISPEEFIPIAEKNGFMLNFSHFLVERICSDMLELEEKIGEKPNISINISSRQLLDSTFMDSIIKTMEQTNISKSRVKLEIRENLLSSDTEVVLPIMRKLEEAGLEMSLDDFGTGASSLSYINKIPIKELKIDKNFIAGIPEDKHCVALVRSIIAIASTNNFLVIAEGVENKKQSEWLIREGCNLMQGFFYVKPLTFKKLLAWYEENKVLPPQKMPVQGKNISTEER